MKSLQRHEENHLALVEIPLAEPLFYDGKPQQREPPQLRTHAWRKESWVIVTWLKPRGIVLSRFRRVEDFDWIESEAMMLIETFADMGTKSIPYVHKQITIGDKNVRHNDRPASRPALHS